MECAVTPVHNNLRNSICESLYLGPHLLLCLIFRDAANEQTAVVDGFHNANVVPWSQLVLVQLLDGSIRVFAIGVLDEGEAAIRSAEVHHETKLVDGSDFGEQPKQFVLVHVARDFANEHLTALWWWRAYPICKGKKNSKLSYAVMLLSW